MKSLTPVRLSTRAKHQVDERLISRQMAARAVVVRNGKNVDRAPIDFDRLPIG